MSHKTELQSNNVDLQSILATINALPEAGGGGGVSVETCNVTFSLSIDMPDLESTIAYTDSQGNGVIKTLSEFDNHVSGAMSYDVSGNFSAMAETLLFIQASAMFGVSGNATTVDSRCLLLHAGSVTIS